MLDQILIKKFLPSFQQRNTIISAVVIFKESRQQFFSKHFYPQPQSKAVLGSHMPTFQAEASDRPWSVLLTFVHYEVAILPDRQLCKKWAISFDKVTISQSYLDAMSIWFELNPEKVHPLKNVARQINATVSVLLQPV